MFTLSLFYTPRLLCCCVRRKQGMVNRAAGWSPFSGLPGHTVKSADRRRALSFQHEPALLLSSPFCAVACLWLPESMELPSYILKGLLRNPPVCSFFIPSTLLSLFTFECQSIPSFSSLSLPVCISLKKYFCIPLFSFCFSHSLPPAHSDAAPSHSHIT